MGLEMVQHDAHHRGVWGAFVAQPRHGMGEVELRPLLFCHLPMPPARLRFHAEQEGARAVAGVCVIIALRPAEPAVVAGSLA